MVSKNIFVLEQKDKQKQERDEVRKARKVEEDVEDKINEEE